MLPIAFTAEEFRDWALGAPLRIVLIVIAAAIVSRLARRAIKLGLRRMGDARLHERLAAARALAPQALLETREHEAERTGQRLDALAAVLASAAGFVVWLIALFTVLAELKVNIGPLLAGAGIAGIAIGFGAQSLVRDFLAGAFILIEDQFAVGDEVDLGDAVGVVEAISLRTTRLRSADGAVWYVPNGQIARIGNSTQRRPPPEVRRKAEE